MIPGLIARMRSLWRGIRRRTDLESEMSEEFRLHLELRAQELVRSGLSSADAARQARREFGSVERYKDEARESRGLRRVDELRVSWLDFKLGFRMLARYPGLTIVGGLAMAFAIWIGAGSFELATQLINPTLPLDEGDRVVALRNWDASRNSVEGKSLHDFTTWRAELVSVRDVGAYRSVARNLITGEGQGQPIEVVEISASAFRVTRVPPLLGRALLDTDELPGAPPVAVIGHDLWTSRFASDPDVIGRTVRLGRSQATVVGIMPEGYEFPSNQSFWVPLRINVLEYQRRQGPSINVFGRLAPGATLADAQAELTTIGTRTATDFPQTHEHLRPQVLPFAKSVVDLPSWAAVGIVSVNVPVVMLLLLICSNVALLMFARTATRETEIAVRNALGASRGRIIMQLFAEALVLGGVAAVIGLAAAGAGLGWLMDIIELEMLEGQRLPFWFSPTLSPTTILYALGLTVLAAVISGVLPALKVTRGIGARLQQASAGAGGMRLGGLWTVVIITQVAVTMAFPAVAFLVQRDAVQIRAIEARFPAQEFLGLRLEMDRDPPPGAPADTSRAAFLERYRATYQALERRLEGDPGVASVTFAERLPRMYHPHRLIEVDDGGAAPRHPGWPDGYRVSDAAIDPDYFDVLGTPILAGRRFHAGDLASGAAAVIVNQSFVRLVFGDRNPLGRRLRYVHREEWDGPREDEKASPWYEIVGVVRDMGMADARDPKIAGIYHPATPDRIYPAQVAVHVKGEPEAFIPRLRALATETDPTLRLYEVTSLDALSDTELAFIAFWFRMLLGVSAIALTLSLAGIYAVMAFTVARRTREIGIRVALGADARRVVTAVFRRPLTQVGIGIGVGVLLLMLMASGDIAKLPTPKYMVGIVAYALFMMGVCMLACIVPTRRALRIEPTEALKGDG